MTCTEDRDAAIIDMDTTMRDLGDVGRYPTEELRLMTSQSDNENPLPESLVVAVDESQVAAVAAWWSGLTETQRHELLDDATNHPDIIANQTDIGCSSDDEEPSEWYEYVVNQDMRFYFDRHNGCQTSHGYIVYPMLSAISAAADANVVSHVLKRNGG